MDEAQLLVIKEIAHAVLDPEHSAYQAVAAHLDLSDECLAELRRALDAELQEQRTS
ncbi:MAG: hypothetical protein JXM73_04665 [Anaerolineae bacterium]|nr:hypothetical protein [Anaerolineae bacterium]